MSHDPGDRPPTTSADERRSPRANVLLKAELEHRSARIAVRVGNLSAHGAMVVGAGLPAIDTRIIFHCNGRDLAGYIAWVDADRAGIGFDDAVEPDMLARKKPNLRASIIEDTRTIDFRRPGFRGNQLSDEERKIVDKWNPQSPDPADGGEPD